MRVDDLRILYDYDRWATIRILNRAVAVPPFEWSDSNRIDRRGLGGILAHALGAHERWRCAWQGIEEVAQRERGFRPVRAGRCGCCRTTRMAARPRPD